MVNKRRSLVVGASCAALLMTAAAPAMARYIAADPSPLRQKPIVRLLDVAASENDPSDSERGPVVAVGWRESAKPGELFLTFSTDGGKKYLKQSGKMRKARILGQGNLGMAVDVCDGKIWVASAANLGGDTAGDSDVILTARFYTGSGDQGFMTNSSASRKIRDLSLACVGDKMLAIAWLEMLGGKPKGKLMLRSLETPSDQTPEIRKVYGLGDALPNGGITVAATGDAAYVAWTKGAKKNVRFKRFEIGPADDLTIDPKPTITPVFAGAFRPELAARGQKVVLAYTRSGRVLAKISTNLGKSFGGAKKLIGTGTVRSPSKVHSVDLSSQRVTVEATKSKNGASIPQRIESTNLGATWKSTPYGHKGPRMGALIKLSNTQSRLAEVWHNNGSSKDTMRGQREVS